MPVNHVSVSRFRRRAVLLAALSVAAAACADDLSDAAPTTTVAAPDATTATTVAPSTTLMPVKEYDIVATALRAHVFTQLAGMVADAGLVDTLRSEGPFTVFAPTNDAFQKLPVATLHSVQDDPELLATVLTYHVVAGEYTLADLEEGTLETVAGINLTITKDGDQTLVNGFPIAAGDVQATNGVIHVMGDVLVPEG